ncbi:MAG: ABC transporter permease [Phycisphaerae bacterium]|nr:ABC transporter permease [Phycisphaerae bacterium]
MTTARTRRLASTWTLGSISAVALFMLYLPVAVLVVFSFNSARTGAVWESFTLDWYRSIPDDRQLMRAISNSLWIALIATPVSTVLATMLALGMEGGRFRGKRSTEQVLNLPIVAPEIITGVSLLAAMSLALRFLNDVLGRGNADAIRFGRPTILLAHIAFDTAFATLIVRASLRNLDPALAEASLDLGATRWQTFWRVILPAIRPGVLGGALMALTLSIDNFVITFFVTGPGSTTLPIEIYARLRRTISPSINAVATLIFAASIVVLVAALFAQALGSAKRKPSAEAPVQGG